MPASHRIVVTGLGAVSAFGWGAEALEAGLGSGATAIGPFDRFDNRRFPTHTAAQVPPPPELLGRDLAAWPALSWAERFALAAARQAARQAGLPADLSHRRAGVFFGSSTGGMLETEGFYARFRGRSLERSPRTPVAAQQVNRPADGVARLLGVTGPVQTVSSACASGALAIGLALDALREGAVEVALAGGADSLCRLTFGGFNSLRSVDPEPCRPFLRDRAGLSLGEGAAVLVLARSDSGTAAGAEPLAELLGAGASADAHHMTAPRPDGAGAAEAVRRALADARTSADRIDFINAHGTGTELNDLAEFRALETVFGERLSSIPLTSTKASLGHLLGSAGAIEAAATVLALARQSLPATPGEGPLDPRTPVRISRRGTPAACRAALSVNLGFGGCNAALVFARTGG